MAISRSRSICAVTFFVEVEHWFVEPRHHGAKAERPVIVELQFDCPGCTVERLLLLAGARDVEITAGHDPAPLLGIPTELEPAAIAHVGEPGLFRRLVVDLDVTAQPVVRFGDHYPVDPMLGREFERPGAGQRLPQLGMRLLQRLREDLQLLEGSSGRLHRIAGRVHIRVAKGNHVCQPPPHPLTLEIGDRLLVVPLGVGGRDREELAVMRERRLGPTFLHHRDGFFERLAVALLVLDRRAVGAAERFVLAGLIAASDAALDPSAADHVEQRNLLGEAHRMVPDDDVGGLAEPDALGVRRHAHLHHQRVRAHLRALGLEMVFGEPERLEPELFGEDPLPHLVHQRVLCRSVDLRQRSVIERDAVLVSNDRQAGRPVVEQADFEHRFFPPLCLLARTGQARRPIHANPHAQSTSDRTVAEAERT